MEPAPPEASPDRLTALLREAGVLLDGVVTAVEVESARETLVSRLTRLRLTYGDGGGPSHVFMKSTRDGTDARLRDFGQKEVGFYRLVAGDTPAGLLPRCYKAMVEPVVEATRGSMRPGGTTRAWASRWAPSWTSRACSTARWPRCRPTWPRLPTGWASDSPPSVATGTSASSRLDRAWPSGIAPTAISRSSTATPTSGTRYSHVRGMRARGWSTATRGAWTPPPTTWRYTLALHWYPDWRDRHERDTLHRYHDALVRHGVEGYPFDTLWQDYRLSVL